MEHIGSFSQIKAVKKCQIIIDQSEHRKLKKRTICRDSMKMCRDNKESILAVLAAFVEDPVVLESQKTKMAQKQAQMTFDSRRHKFAAAEMQPAFKIIRRVEDKLGISSNSLMIQS